MRREGPAATELATWSGRREPADQPSEQQPNLRRKSNVSRHADEDPKRHADRRAQDDRPDASAISARSVRHRRSDPGPRGTTGQAWGPARPAKWPQSSCELPGSFARMHLRIAVTDAPADLPERLEDAPEPFWRHVRDAVLAYREEREEED
jgi:hypothetical protein